MQTLVASLVPEDLRGAIRFTKSGELDASALADVTTSNLLFLLLRSVAADSETIRLEFGDEHAGDLSGGWVDMRPWKSIAPGLPDFTFEGTAGRFVPGNPYRNANTLPDSSMASSDGNAAYILRPFGNTGWTDLARRTVAEELLGHGWLFLNGLKWEHTYQGSAVDQFIISVLNKIPK
jgi:hypothetical protein